MGRLIVLDGGDGSGKTTQFERMDRWLTEQGVPHKSISFPDYAQPSSALVRQYLAGDFGGTPEAVNAYAASSFYAVDRYASYKRFWQADYERGDLILAARYTTSNAIHQMPKLPREQWDGYLSWLFEYEYDRMGLPRPDAVWFLDMPPEAAKRLLEKRYAGDETKKDIHEQDIAYAQQCRQAALYAAHRLDWQVVSCADGGQPLPTEVIAARLQELLMPLLK